MLPALILGPAWVLITSAEVAAYRMTNDGEVPLEQFDPVWKLGYMLDHPLHFPRLLAANLAQNWAKLARQLVGVHGWLDTPLHPVAYPMLPILLLATLEPLRLPPAARARMAVVLGVIMLIYALGVYFIFYLIWTPLAANIVYGVQGRYFVVLLPLITVLFAAAIERAPLWRDGAGRGHPGGRGFRHRDARGALARELVVTGHHARANGQTCAPPLEQRCRLYRTCAAGPRRRPMEIPPRPARGEYRG